MVCLDRPGGGRAGGANARLQWAWAEPSPVVGRAGHLILRAQLVCG
jgi:hypothetical protein